MPPSSPPLRRSLLFWGIVLVDGALWVAAFTWQPPEVHSAPILAVNVWPGTETFIVARNSGRIPNQTINFVEISWSSSAMRAFANHALDAAVLTLNEALQLRELGQSMKVLAVIDESVGADALVGKPGISRMADLKGRKVAVEMRSAGQYLLGRALHEAGMSWQDVEMVPIIAPESALAFGELGVDAVATAEPWLTHLLKNGGTVLCDSSKFPGEMQRVLVVREDLVRKNAADLADLVNAHFETLPLHTQPAPVLKVLQQRETLTPVEWEAVFSKIRMVPRADQGKFLSGPGAQLKESLTIVHEHLKAYGMMEDAADWEIPLDDRFVVP
ncbi:MAG TPA: ABC transporter substrate-binding protein [Verrucomicrobiales bacterium]|nr:ABC transporter substrate-binding protein [Akkermansiaceae bacterium]HRX54637.1 ABC transporter substrate-binding protein [Verrucomicrobiales bacterium]